MRVVLLIVLPLLFQLNAAAQLAFTATIVDRTTNQPLTGVTVVQKGDAKNGGVTDENGNVRINASAVPAIFTITYTGYKQLEYIFQGTDTGIHKIFLETDAQNLDEVVIVASTRSNDRIETAATKVEVLGQEEMNEESTLKPGNVASILGDISGVQIQQSSVTNGNTNIRIQGLDGKYTQLLRDGMPVYEGFSGGFGVLSIAPLDLKQIELIKGSASTLYGGGAIAGLVNFISKKPGTNPEVTALVNYSTLNEANANFYAAKKWKKVGFTFFAGQNYQKLTDVNKDGLSDLPETISTTLHPTLFIYPSENSSISIGWSGNIESRKGGDMIGVETPGALHPFFEKNQLVRNAFSIIGENKFNDRVTGYLKASYSRFDREETTNSYYFKGGQDNIYTELSLSARVSKHFIVSGINLTADKFMADHGLPVPISRLTNTAGGIFIQDTWPILERTRIEAGLRADCHNVYGGFLLPRLAVFHHLNENWGTRLGFGMGYKTPNPLAPQIIDYSIYDLVPLPANIKAEHSYGANMELNYKKEYSRGNSFFINQAFFLTSVSDPVIGAEDNAGHLFFYNGTRPVLTYGFDTYTQWKIGDLEIYLGYTYTIAERKYLSTGQFMPYTPRDRAAATVVYEIEHKWRMGLEGSYNGRQYRYNASKTPGYFFIAAMVERKFGSHFSMVLNGENLLDERQSKYEPLYTGSITNPQFKPLWAPVDGRVINLSLKWQL